MQSFFVITHTHKGAILYEYCFTALKRKGFKLFRPVSHNLISVTSHGRMWSTSNKKLTAKSKRCEK